MPDSFGARLRQQRERQAVEFCAIAEQTKIKQSLLEALERDDVSQWPSGIFRRAFVRAYAQAIALEPDLVVREFLQLYPDPAEDTALGSALAEANDGATTSGGPPTRLRYMVGSAIGSLAGLRLGGIQRRRAPIVPGDGPAAGRNGSSAPRSYAHVRPISPPAPLDQTSESDTANVASAVGPEHAPVDSQRYEPPPFEGETDAAAGDAIERAEVGEGSDTAAVESHGVTDRDLAAAANLCTELGRMQEGQDIRPLLQEAARLLDAAGLIIWIADASGAELSPVLAHGYSDRVLAQVPSVPADADNATAAAFRSAQIAVVHGSEVANGALVVPLITAAACVGVLSMETQRGSEQRESIRALATIFAAQLAAAVSAGDAAAADRRFA